MTTDREIVQFATSSDLAEAATNRFVAAARDAIAQRGRFLVALSGGSTPRAMYEKLAEPATQVGVAWESVHLFFSDERFVPPDSTESNYHTAHAELISKVPIPQDNVHSYATVGLDPSESAARYEDEIRTTVGGGDAVPRFDLICLGMGPDGHTASLFPGTAALTVTDRSVVENFVPSVDMWRLTFTYPLLNGARTVMFLVQGEDKAQRVREVLCGDSELPAASVRPQPGTLVWLLDSTAASQYDTSARSAAEER